MAIIRSQVMFAVIVILVTVFTLLAFWIRNKRYQKKFIHLDTKPIQAPTEPAIQPRSIFIDVSPKTADVVELAVEVWRISNRLMKASADLSDTQKRGLESSVQKFIKFLDHYDIKFIDHTGQKYNEGMNVTVMSFEQDQSVHAPVIKETVEPSIVHGGVVVKKGKVIVINN